MFEKINSFRFAGAISLAVVTTATPAFAARDAETELSGPAAAFAGGFAAIAREDAAAAFGEVDLKPNTYKWSPALAKAKGPASVVVSLSQQMAYVYKGGELVGMASVSSGKPGKDTYPGVFPIVEKKPMHHSRKYDNAPMPFMQRFDEYGTALHAGFNPGEPASHGCVRLPRAFAAKLFTLTKVGDQVIIEA
jgi:hypothetical protein